MSAFDADSRELNTLRITVTERDRRDRHPIDEGISSQPRGKQLLTRVEKLLLAIPSWAAATRFDFG